MGPRSLLLWLAAVILAAGFVLTRLLTAPPEAGPGVHQADPSGESAGGTTDLAHPGTLRGDSARDRETAQDLIEPNGGLASDQGADASDLVDLIVLDRTGEPFFRRGSPLAQGVGQWVQPMVGVGVPPAPGERLPEGAEDLSGNLQRIKRLKGWFSSFEPPGDVAWAALCYGEFVVVAEPVESGSTGVTLMAGFDEVEAMQCSVVGSVPGRSFHSSMAKVVPAPTLKRRGVRGPIYGTGSEGGFTVVGIPPGRSQLVVGGNAVTLELATKPDGLTTEASERWRERIGHLAGLEIPLLSIGLDLAPGEVRELGPLDAGLSSFACALLIHLVDESGNGVEAKGVHVERLRGGSGLRGGGPSTWIFESEVCVYPLPSSPVELQITSGGKGTLVQVTPGPGRTVDSMTRVTARLEPLALVVLPEEAGARLETEQGHVTYSDPRWVGSTLNGREVDERALAVPAGRYRLVRSGEIGATIHVEAGEHYDLSEAERGS